MGRTWKDSQGNAKRKAKHIPYGGKRGETFPMIKENDLIKEGSAIPVNKRGERQKNRIDLRDIEFDD